MIYKTYPIQHFLELYFAGAKPNGRYYIVDLNDTEIYHCDDMSHSFDEWMDIINDKDCYVMANMDGDMDGE